MDACLPRGGGFNGAVTFNCGGAATIPVTGTKYISADTVIDGGGLVKLSGGNRVGVLSVNSGVKLTIDKLTVANGSTSDFPGGGGVYVDMNGTLIATNSTFSDNIATGATASGGAISNFYGNVTLSNDVFSDNTTANDGGAIDTLYGSVTVASSTFFQNRANFVGGGIHNGGSALTVTNSTFFGNSTTGNGGGIYHGGGTSKIINSTIAGNHANLGGGIYNLSDSFEPITVTNTIISGSTSGGNCAGNPISDGGHNIADGISCNLNVARGSLSNTAPGLDPAGLQNNGGLTQTVALQAGSPAINAGDQTVCAAPPVNSLDQRGFYRPGAGSTKCSIGAYEFKAQGPSVQTPTPTVTETGACVGDCDRSGDVTVNEIIALVNIDLGDAAASACPYGIPSPVSVDIGLIIQAVNAALTGCSASTPTPRATEKVTPTPVCGNGIRETGEECDGSDFGGATCQSAGFDCGTLVCNTNCTANTSGCAKNQCSTFGAMRCRDSSVQQTCANFASGCLGWSVDINCPNGCSGSTCAGTPTTTATKTATRTPTLTPQPPTPTYPPSPTFTSTATYTFTPTFTFSRTPTRTRTWTFTPTFTNTPAPSPTIGVSLVLINEPPCWDARPPAGPVVQLYWTNLPDAASYEVYRTGTQIASRTAVDFDCLRASGCGFRNELGLTAGQTYVYFVRAHRSSGAIVDSDPVNVSIPSNVQTNSCSGAPTPTTPAMTPTPAPITFAAQHDASGKFAVVVHNVSQVSTNEVSGSVEFVNSTGTWFLVSRTDNTAIPDSVIPYAFLAGPHAVIRFPATNIGRGQYIRFDAARFPDNDATIAMVAIDLIGRGLFDVQAPSELTSAILDELTSDVTHAFGSFGDIADAINQLHNGNYTDAVTDLADWFKNIDVDSLVTLTHEVFALINNQTANSVSQSLQDIVSNAVVDTVAELASTILDALDIFTLPARLDSMEQLATDTVQAPLEGYGEVTAQ